MSDAAIRKMTLVEFLRWDDGTETHYELISGFPVAMAPPAEVHRILAMRLGSRIDAALSGRRPCNAKLEAGIIRPDWADSYFEADIAATCAPSVFGRQAIEAPFLVVEIRAPSATIAAPSCLLIDSLKPCRRSC
jgi:Uma2 family endonuclease